MPRNCVRDLARRQRPRRCCARPTCLRAGRQPHGSRQARRSRLPRRRPPDAVARCSEGGRGDAVAASPLRALVRTCGRYSGRPAKLTDSPRRIARPLARWRCARWKSLEIATVSASTKATRPSPANEPDHANAWGAQVTCAPHRKTALKPAVSHLAGRLLHRLLFLLGILLLLRLRVRAVGADGGQDHGRAERGDHGGENELLHGAVSIATSTTERSASCGCRDNPGECRGAAGFVLIGGVKHAELPVWRDRRDALDRQREGGGPWRRQPGSPRRQGAEFSRVSRWLLGYPALRHRSVRPSQAREMAFWRRAQARTRSGLRRAASDLTGLNGCMSVPASARPPREILHEPETRASAGSRKEPSGWTSRPGPPVRAMEVNRADVRSAAPLRTRLHMVDKAPASPRLCRLMPTWVVWSQGCVEHRR